MEGSSVVLLDLLVPYLFFELEFELDEVLDFVLSARREPLVLAQELVLAIVRGTRRILVEEVGDVHLEDRKDLEESLQADFVFPVLHPAQIGLLDPDAVLQILLGERTILWEWTGTISDQKRRGLQF